MIDHVVALTAVSTTVSLLGLWVLFFWLYRDYRVDLFRQRMFTLRDELFEYAAAGNIAFDAPAYGLMRDMLNGYIRFAHRLNLVLVTLTLRDGKTLRVRTANLERVQAALAKQPPETRKKLEQLLSQMHWYVVDQLVLTSALMWLVIVPVAVFTLVRALGERVMRFLRGWWIWQAIKRYWIGPMDSTALAAGAH
jgi:hypothetical protein